MNNQSNYNIPKTRKEKADVLQAILRGEKSIDSLKESGYKVFMWMEDINDPDYFINFNGIERISKADFEKEKLVGKGTYVTLNLDEKLKG